jgi:anti-sigma B factor antagonist
VEAPEHLNGQVVVVEVHDRTEAETSAHAPLLVDRLRGLLNRGYKYLLLNVGELTYVDSVMLGAMIEAYSAAIRHGGSVKLLHVNKRFRQLLVVTKLDGVFDSFESEDTAVASFPSSAGKNKERQALQPDPEHAERIDPGP